MKRFSDHLEAAKLERDFYREATIAANKELEERKGRLNSRGGACSQNLQASHYTFDFAQSVSIPYHATNLVLYTLNLQEKYTCLVFVMKVYPSK